MPIYEFRCESCESVFEQLRKRSDKSVATCSSCGSEQTHRIMSNTAFTLKGGGWYVTDYSTSDGALGKPAAEPSKGAEGGESSSSDASSGGESSSSSSSESTGTSGPSSGSDSSSSKSTSSTDD